MNPFITHSFIVKSSSDIHPLITEIAQVTQAKSIALVHINAYIHNTVLVHNFKHELLEIFPELNIVELHHENKNEVLIRLYTHSEETTINPIEHSIIHQLSHENKKLE